MNVAFSGRASWCRPVVILVAGLLAILVAGCGGPSRASVLADNRKILAICDGTHPPASWVAIDATGSSAAEAIREERLAAVESVVRETAVCSGYLKVLVFSSSSTSTATLFDGSLRQAGATENARLQRVPGAVAAAMATIRKVYAPSVAGLDQQASDITAQFRLAGEWQQQLGGAYRLHAYVLTDGFQTAGVDLGAQALDRQDAIALAQQVAVPMLPGARVVVAGLGRIASTEPRSGVVEGLVAYYDALCHRMAAAKCVSVSDYQAAGW